MLNRLARVIPAACIGLVALLPATATLADDYRFEVRGGLDLETPTGANDISVASLSGTWYFEPVSTDDVPLAEAAFLGRASNLAGVIAHADGFVDTTLDSQGLAVSYFIPETIFFARLGLLHAEEVIGVSSTTLEKRSDTRWFGSLGVAPIKGLLVTTDFQEDGYDPNLKARHVGKLPNDHYYAGSVGIVDPDFGDTSFSLDFDYFFSHATSMGVGYSDLDDRFEIRAEKFFSDNWVAGFSVFTAEFSEGFGVHVAWRH